MHPLRSWIANRSCLEFSDFAQYEPLERANENYQPKLSLSSTVSLPGRVTGSFRARGMEQLAHSFLKPENTKSRSLTSLKIATIRIRWHSCRKLTRKKELSMKCIRLKRVSEVLSLIHISEPTRLLS